jgi:hypothetical protein
MDWMAKRTSYSFSQSKYLLPFGGFGGLGGFGRPGGGPGGGAPGGGPGGGPGFAGWAPSGRFEKATAATQVSNSLSHGLIILCMLCFVSIGKEIENTGECVG